MHQLMMHPAIAAIAAYWTFSAFVGGMPDVSAKSSSGYIWLYNSLHILAGNLTAAVASKYPNLPAGSTLNQHVDTQIRTPPAP